MTTSRVSGVVSWESILFQCKAVSGRGGGPGWWDNGRMANLVMVYGLRLLPADEVAKVGVAPVELKNGNEAHVTMHVLEGSREQIEAQLRLSIDAFFDFYPEIQ